MCHSCGRSQVVPQGERHTYREMSCSRCGRLMRRWRHSLFCDNCRRGMGPDSAYSVSVADIAGQEERIARYAARAAAGKPLFEEDES